MAILYIYTYIMMKLFLPDRITVYPVFFLHSTGLFLL